MSYTELFGSIRERCLRGRARDIDEVLALLDDSVELPVTKAVDLYLGQVSNPEGIERIEYCLFNGTQIQRNYCTLFFARRNEWKVVNRAYDLGLVDWIQAYSR